MDNVVKKTSPIAIDNRQAVQGFPGLQHHPGTKIQIARVTEDAKADVSEVAPADRPRRCVWVYPGIACLCVRVQFAPEESLEVGRYLGALEQLKQLNFAYIPTRGGQSVGVLIFKVGRQSSSRSRHEAYRASASIGKCLGPRGSCSGHWPDGTQGPFGNSLQSNHAIPRPHHRDVR